MFVCECGRIFKSKNSRSAHYKYCQIHRNEHNMGEAPKPFETSDHKFNFGWSRGLTADTNSSILKAKNTRKENLKNGKWIPHNRGKYSCKKIMNEGYISYYMPDHPLARSNGLVFEHTIVAENKLGRHLKCGEVVHHIDGNKLNNSELNLMVFDTKSDHSRYHMCKLKNVECLLIEQSDGSYKCIVSTT